MSDDPIGPVEGTYRGMPVSISNVDAENRAYFAYCAEGEFRLQRGVESGLLRYPPTTACPWTRDRDYEWVPVDPRGAVHSYTEVHHAIQPAFRDHTPYLILLVDLDTQLGQPTEHEALRVAGNLVTADGELAPPDVVATVGIGTRVRMVFVPVADGLAIPNWTIDDEAEQPSDPWRYPGEAEVVVVSLDDVERAAEVIASDVVRTPMSHSRTLSGLVGAEVHLKFENLQFTGSFKDRGSANHLRTLAERDRRRGIVALSAGNHAQGVAYHAGRLELPATIVMPESAPFNKVVNTRALGAEVVQSGATFAEARSKLDELVADYGYRYVPPYDDAAVIAGQGTVALEMLADRGDLDVLVVPVGGGGLISGMAVAAKALKPDIEVVGVQVEAYASVAAALAGREPPPGGVDTLADGIAVKTVGTLTFPLIETLVDEVLVVTEDSTERAIALYLEIEKTVAEGAGAVPLAALLQYPSRFAGKRVGLVVTGGNIDSRVLASVLMRSLVRTGRISTLRMEIGDLPGQLAPVVAAIAAAGANVIEVDHRRLFDPISARSTKIDIVVETRDAKHRQSVIAALETLGHDVAVLA